MPHPRATALFVRTVYRELRRANYDRAGLVGFVADLAELIAANANVSPSDVDGDVTGVVDPVTGLPNHSAFEEVLEFEMNRARQGPAGQLLMIVIEAAIPEWMSDEQEWEVHLQVADSIRQSLRQEDSVFRLAPQRYILLLPHARHGVAQIVYARLAKVLHVRRRASDQGARSGDIQFSARAAAWTMAFENGEAFLSSCLESSPTLLTELFPAEAPSQARTQRTLSDRAELPPSVVLALGGGAGRAAAHVGVLRALASAGIEVRGIAGTSAGALVGAMVLNGQTPDEILVRFSSFADTALYREMRRLYAQFLNRSRKDRAGKRAVRGSGLALSSDTDLAAISDELYQDFIAYMVGRNTDISALSKPFAVSATDLVAGRSVFLARGPLHAALRASCAVPGLFRPQTDGGRILADGAIISDVPIQAAALLDPEAAVLGVYLGRPESRVTAFRSAAEVHVRAAAIVHTELVREQLRRSPMLVTAEVGEVGWLDFRRAARTAHLGEASTHAALQSLLGELTRASDTDR
jgi:NTE family protein